MKQLCRHAEPIRFAARNLLLPPEQQDPDYCGCCGRWLAGAAFKRCDACREAAHGK